jgi:hypothetical protein
MYKTLLLTLVLVLSAAWVAAQSQDPQSASGSPQQGSSQKGNASAGQMSVQGCLQGSGGNFTLMADSGTTYQLTGDTAKLSKHVGHQVEITGSTSGAGASASGSGSGMSQSSSAGGSQTLTVEKMKHVSATCKSAAGK